MTQEIVPALKYPRESSNPHAVDLHHPGVAQVVYVWRHPASVGELLQVVGGLVVPADEDSEDRGYSLAAVVLVEAAH